MVIDRIIRNKINLIFIPIVLTELYYLQYAKVNGGKPIDIYVCGLFNMYDKGILIAGFLLMAYLVISEFDKNIIVSRYKNVDLWIKDIYIRIMKKTAFMVLFINILPVIFALTEVTISPKDCVVILMYIVNQIATLSILVFTYILLFAVTHNKIYNFVGIFIALYGPKFLLEALRRNYITPINIIFFDINMKVSSMLIQTNIMIIIFSITAYTIQRGIFKDKYRDIIWRF